MTNEDVVTLNGKDILLSAAFKCFVFDFSEWRYWPIYDSDYSPVPNWIRLDQPGPDQKLEIRKFKTRTPGRLY